MEDSDTSTEVTGKLIRGRTVAEAGAFCMLAFMLVKSMLGTADSNNRFMQDTLIERLAVLQADVDDIKTNQATLTAKLGPLTKKIDAATEKIMNFDAAEAKEARQ